MGCPEAGIESQRGFWERVTASPPISMSAILQQYVFRGTFEAVNMQTSKPFFPYGGDKAEKVLD